MIVALRRLWIQLTSDRRRFGILCGVLGIGLLLWARLIVVSNLPRTAVADNEPARAAARNDNGSPALRTGSIGGAALESGTSARQRPNPQQIKLDALPTRDPFVISPRYFPKPTTLADLPKEAPKSIPEPVEESWQIEARITAQLRALVDRLKLEAVMGSMAVINGKKYRVGDEVPAPKSEIHFRLHEVKHRSVMLELEDRRFELQMSTPGG